MPEPRPRHTTSPAVLLVTWASLVIVTLLGALLSRGGFGRGAAMTLLGFATIKVALIALVFMDLRKAHPAWFLTVGVGALGVGVVSALAIFHVW